MSLHDGHGVVNVLDGVLSARLFDDVVRRNSLPDGELGHGVRLHPRVVRCASAHDDARGNAVVPLAHPCEHALALLR